MMATGGKMNFNLSTLLKAIIGGAGAGFALSGGLSLLIPAFTVTATSAYIFAALGGITVGALAVKGAVG